MVGEAKLMQTERKSFKVLMCRNMFNIIVDLKEEMLYCWGSLDYDVCWISDSSKHNNNKNLRNKGENIY